MSRKPGEGLVSWRKMAKNGVMAWRTGLWTWERTWWFMNNVGTNQIEWLCTQESDGSLKPKTANFMGVSDNKPWSTSLAVQYFQTNPNRVVGGFNLQSWRFLI
jgi:hypothetical protein